MKTPGRRDGWPLENLLQKSSFTFDPCLSATNEPLLLNWGNEGKKLNSSSSLASSDGHISFKKGSKTFCWKYGRQLLNSVKGNCSFILLRSLKMTGTTVCNLCKCSSFCKMHSFFANSLFRKAKKSSLGGRKLQNG